MLAEAAVLPRTIDRHWTASRECSLGEILATDEPIALVTQGGGMRGTYSIAALAALEEAGFTSRFADIYGTSAGALNGTYFVAGQARAGVSVYVDHLSTERFIKRSRLTRVIDIDYLIDIVLKDALPLDFAALKASRSRLHIGLTSVTTGQLTWVDQSKGWPLSEVLRATAALPVVFGREVHIGSDRFVDGGIHAPVPIEQAIADGHRNLLVILTRPADYTPVRTPRWQLHAMRIAARMKRHSPSVISQLGAHLESLERALEVIREAPERDPALRIWCIAPSGPIASRLTRDRGLLKSTAARGRADALAALEPSA